MKEKLYELIQKQQETLFAMADQIHDDPEYDGEEYHASAMLEDYLEQHGFQVERGLENWPTAFRATWGWWSPHWPSVRIRCPAGPGPRLRPSHAGPLHLRHSHCAERGGL